MKPGLGTAAIVLSMCALIAPPAAPAAGARSAPIGSIVQATHDKGAVDTSLEGTTIFDGDNLTTGSTNTLMARLSGPQMYLGSNSGVVLRGIERIFGYLDERDDGRVRRQRANFSIGRGWAHRRAAQRPADGRAHDPAERHGARVDRRKRDAEGFDGGR